MLERTKRDWQSALSDIITDPTELASLLDLDASFIEAAESVVKSFPLKVPRSFVARMNQGDVQDPLLLQVLPLGLEADTAPGFTTDPLGEQRVNPVPGLLHKYPGRVLMVVAGACPIHCRYCFRRHFPYQDNRPSRSQWQRALDYIAADASISEVIFSGGEPLLAPDNHLAELVERIAAIPHVTTLRVHTRMPVVIPERITPECIDWLAGGRLRPVVVLHANHGQEINDEVREACEALAAAGVTLLNQSVILQGVNDSVTALCELSTSLWQVGVMPYYLHLLDPVQGASHFSVPFSRAQTLIQLVRERLPGYLVPRLVREQAGEASKIPMEING